MCIRFDRSERRMRYRSTDWPVQYPSIWETVEEKLLYVCYHLVIFQESIRVRTQNCGGKSYSSENRLLRE